MENLTFKLLICLFFSSSILHGNRDHETLLSIKSSLLGRNGSGLHDWRNDVTHCSFSGVSCGENSRVTSLNISNVPLFGTIPPEIGFLVHLVNLTLSSNNLTGLLPPEFSRLPSLKYVNLSFNKLNGDFQGGIVMKMRDLEVFDVYNNDFTGLLPTHFIRLKQLKLLNLGGCYFSGEIPEVYSMFQNLEVLGLAGNSLVGKIPPAIGNLVELRTLNLDMNSLIGEIPVEISNLKRLSVLNFKDNRLTGGIPDSISLCSKLTSIDLSGNKLRGLIPIDISKLKVLNKLNLSRNQLTGEIPSELGSLNSLTSLDLSYNNFIGRQPTNGMLQITGDLAFAGNPNLCSPHAPVCPSDSGHVSKRAGDDSFGSSKVVIIVIAVVTVIVLFALTSTLILKRNYKKSNAWKLTAFQRLDFKAEDVLDCLKDENIIGTGGAGIVYRGSMSNGSDVAIKQLSGRGSGHHDDGFSAEIQTLGKIRHKHIVGLLGYVSNRDANLLLYDYMSNGSLGEMLHGSEF